ncbi:hypothetical protein GCM10022252_60980 [Streptosporangium oxazolinicum]|uniref:Uncharacterized protein n=1 Tax=Streptosporangium oxazolinicum TaxID=909287 RepID=A0ABP8BCD5_9ACTN
MARIVPAFLTVREFGRLDAVVLNAGIGGAGQLEPPGAIDRFDRILAVNVRGTALGTGVTIPVDGGLSANNGILLPPAFPGDEPR